jgi:thiosulfate dehydrogenase [quinone] large subunit
MKKYKPGYTTSQIITLTVLQILIGWHFLFEGLIKIHTKGWTSKEFLLGSTGPLASFYRNLANSNWIALVDKLNEWGLVFIGLGLFTGLLSKPSKIAGIVLLGLYYLAYPPFMGKLLNPGEGNYWIVNMTLIEMAALFALYFLNTSHISGLDRYFTKKTVLPVEVQLNKAEK